MKKYNIVNHGYDNSQYFQGCGRGNFDYVVTGCGSDAVEAYNDAVEQMYCSEDSEKVDKLCLPRKPRGEGISRRNKVPAKFLSEEENEMYYYVSIQYRFKNPRPKTVYHTFQGWKRATKKFLEVRFDGDRDICEALTGKVSVGSWDGEKGEIYQVSR